MNHSRSPLRGGRQTAGLLALSTVTALLLAACGQSAAAGGSEAPTDGVLRLGVLNDIGQPPDPDVYYSGNGLALTTNMYEGLVRYAPGNHDSAEIVPLLATAWTVSEDNMTYTFTLRDDVVFHDGTPLTSAAVESSFQRRLDVAAGPAYMAEGIASFETPDDQTVILTLAEPNSAFLDYLASPYGPRLISPTAIEEHGGDDAGQTYLSTTSAGTGPYTLTEASVGERYEMQAFEDYWGEEPEFTTIDLPVYTEISAMQLELENGDLHALLGAVPTSSQAGYVESEELEAHQLPSFKVGVLYMNPHRDFLATPEARVAMFESVDWASIVEQVVAYSATPAEGNYPLGALPADLDDRELVFDAAPLAAYVEGLEPGTPVQIGYSAGSSDAEQIANIIAAQLQVLELAATVTAHQSSEVFGTFASDPQNAPDMLVSPGTWPDSNNAYMHGHVFWDAEGGLNHLQCFSDEVSTLLDEALVTGDQEKYAAAGDSAYTAGCAPTWGYFNDFMVTQNWLGGVEEAHSIAAPYTLDFATLTIDE